MFNKVILVVALVAFQWAESFDVSNQYYVNKNQSPYAYGSLQRVKLDVYYEALCSDSVKLYVQELAPLMHRLGPYIDLNTYPYGKAHTYVFTNGSIAFTCQHGEKECYGNKLHACAIAQLGAQYLDYNFCLMAKDSDDNAANQCGILNNVNSALVITCAKSARGDQLLKYMGEESAKVSYKYIPHVVINGVAMAPRTNLYQAVCKAIPNPPAACKLN